MPSGFDFPHINIGEASLLVLTVISVALVVTALLAACIHRALRFLAGQVVPEDSRLVAAGVLTILVSVYLGPSALVVAIALFLRDLRHGALATSG